MEDPEIKKDSEETAELTEKDLDSVAGGTIPGIPIDPESHDDKHKDQINIPSL